MQPQEIQTSKNGIQYYLCDVKIGGAFDGVLDLVKYDPTTKQVSVYQGARHGDIIDFSEKATVTFDYKMKKDQLRFGDSVDIDGDKKSDGGFFTTFSSPKDSKIQDWPVLAFHISEEKAEWLQKLLDEGKKIDLNHDGRSEALYQKGKAHFGASPALSQRPDHLLWHSN